MQQSLPNVKRRLEKYLRRKEVYDIFLIGSAVKGKAFPADIDAVIAFREKKNPSIIQEVKQEQVHAEYVTLGELFTQSLWQTIIREGYSLREKKQVSAALGLSSYGLFTFELTSLKRKARFSQVLHGYKAVSPLEEAKGKQIKPGAVIVPIEKVEYFRAFLETWNVEYGLKYCFMG